MNADFRWLTLLGAVLVLGMGLAGAVRGRRADFKDVGAFALLFAIVMVGRPFVPGSATSSLAPPDVPEVLTLEDPNFPLSELRDLRDVVTADGGADRLPVTVLGMVKRLPRPEGSLQTAVMKSYMVCCAADALGIGFRVAGQRVEGFEDGEWVIVRGYVVPLAEPSPVKPFRVGTSTFVMVDGEYVIEPSTVEPYEAVAYMPLLADRLSSESTSLFRTALEAAGLLEVLRGTGPFTVFAPIDAALEGSEDDLMQPSDAPGRNAELRDWLSRHIVHGRYTKEDLLQLDGLRTIHGRELPVHVQNGKPMPGNVRIVFGNQQARNGVVHLIHPALERHEREPAPDR
jgi:uncharacterized surface protein with fasciclin (FAS1) repeats